MTTPNNIILVGFPQSSIVAELTSLISEENINITVCDVDSFLNNTTDHSVPHLICISLDLDLRKQVIEHADQHNVSRYTYIDSTAKIAKSAVIEAGSFIGPFCYIGIHTHVGHDVIVAPYSMINHYSKIGRGSILHPSSMIAGSTKVGEYCRFSLRATAIDHLTIANNTQVGAGAMLTKDVVEPGDRYLGNPARRIVTPPACHVSTKV